MWFKCRYPVHIQYHHFPFITLLLKTCQLLLFSFSFCFHFLFHPLSLPYGPCLFIWPSPSRRLSPPSWVSLCTGHMCSSSSQFICHLTVLQGILEFWFCKVFATKNLKWEITVDSRLWLTYILLGKYLNLILLYPFSELSISLSIWDFFLNLIIRTFLNFSISIYLSIYMNLNQFFPAGKGNQAEVEYPVQVNSFWA